MADIFLSYASEDRGKAEDFARELEKEGFTIWWDRNIYGGADFSVEIKRELAASKVVIVLWSKLSGESEWVRDEAAQARNDDKLIPIRLDEEGPPLGFRQRQAVDFQGWKGDGGAPAFQALVAAVKHALTGEAQPFVRTGAAHASITSKPLFKWGLIAAGVLALVIFVSVFALRSSPSNERRLQATAAEEAELTTLVDADIEGIGLVVLPFVNMSSDPEQEYFADGLTEELLNWLANVEGLNVPGRTTSFQFKGKTDDLRAIAGNLGVRYILEGSVRRAGDQLRITAQLIQAESGFHLWSKTYDRELNDIFAIQDDVAQNVVTELLGAIPESGAANPANVSDVDPRAHDFYLQGRALVARRNWPAAFMKFYEAIQIDPDHALAHAYVAFTGAQTYSVGTYPKIPIDDFQSVIDRSLARAVALKPNAADVLFAQGWVLSQTEKEIDPESALARRVIGYYERAVRANPRHADALHALAGIAENEEEQIAAYARLVEIEPGHAAARANLFRVYFNSGDVVSARRLIDETLRLFPATSRTYVVDSLRMLGNAEDAFMHYLRDWNEPDLSFSVRRRRAVALADLGAVPEAAFLLRKAASETPGKAAKNWTASLAAYLEADWEARIQLMQRANQAEIGQPVYEWAKIEYGRALIEAGDASRGLERLREIRPDLEDGAQPEIRLTRDGNTDNEAYAVARALKIMGRAGEAEKIWRAVQQALPEIRQAGWRGDVAAAIVHANTGGSEKALASLEAAYEGGFRFLYSFDCSTCIDRDFYEPDGLFATIYETPEFQEYRTRIEQENAATLARLNERYGFLERIREEMKESAED